MQKQLTDAEQMADIKTLETLLKTFTGTRKEQIDRLMDGNLGTVFCTAPASSRTEFHSCYAGGLLRHSLNVTKFLSRLAKGFAPNKWTDETLVLVGLFHDLGKTIDGNGEEIYVPNPSDWHREKLGALYEINKEVRHMAISDRSLFLLQKFGVALSEEEFLAIKLADGQNVRENEGYRYKEPELAVLLATANTLAERSEKASS